MKVWLMNNKEKARWEAKTLTGRVMDKVDYTRDRRCYYGPEGPLVARRLLEIEQKAKGRTVYTADP